MLVKRVPPASGPAIGLACRTLNPFWVSTTSVSRRDKISGLIFSTNPGLPTAKLSVQIGSRLNSPRAIAYELPIPRVCFR